MVFGWISCFWLIFHGFWLVFTILPGRVPPRLPKRGSLHPAWSLSLSTCLGRSQVPEEQRCVLLFSPPWPQFSPFLELIFHSNMLVLFMEPMLEEGHSERNLILISGSPCLTSPPTPRNGRVFCSGNSNYIPKYKRSSNPK